MGKLLTSVELDRVLESSIFFSVMYCVMSRKFQNCIDYSEYSDTEDYFVEGN